MLPKLIKTALESNSLAHDTNVDVERNAAIDLLINTFAGQMLSCDEGPAPRFCVLTSPQDLAELDAFRRRQYQRLLPYMLPTLERDRQEGYDERSWVFAARYNGQIIATARMTPHPFESMDHVAPAAMHSFIGEDLQHTYVEYSRVVVSPDITVHGLMAGMLTYAGLRMLTTTSYRKYFGYASARVAPKFQQFGVDTADFQFTIPSRGDHVYTLVKGDFLHGFQLLVHRFTKGTRQRQREQTQQGPTEAFVDMPIGMA
ncbi:MAG: hypothetical protein MJE77_05345 [Proteobacteria bacterium]|nr:hypothetical protein [Pseudomonadota bacterium]